jgi:hypothetical protein
MLKLFASPPTCRQLLSLSFAGMGLSMLAMAAGLALPFLSGAHSLG